MTATPDPPSTGPGSRSGSAGGSPAATGAIRPFSSDPDLDFDVRCLLGQAGHGAGDVGMWLATAATVTDGDRSSWFTAWTGRGDQLAAVGESSAATDPVGASWAHLAASSAYSAALLAVDGLPAELSAAVTLPTFRNGRRCWEAVIDLSGGRYVRFEVPYEGTVLPGWLLRPDASGDPRPTLVITNGSDGALTSLWPMASEALARGWNAAVFDGPGQQSMLFEHGVPFRPDWEAVLTPVVDVLVARPDVDAGALTAYGISQGGYWLPRALAFEHRFVAAVADGGVVDVSRTWLEHLPAELVSMLDTGQKDAFNEVLATVGSDPAVERTFAFRARPYGISDPFDLFTAVRQYDLRGVAADIRTPLLVTDPVGEQFFPGQPAELAGLLTAPHELVHFTAADGADLHCQPLAQRLLTARVYAWYTTWLQRAGR
ncbi:prolyl oligopeptidase family protein [Geodermatophilus tzadiensis]|uniref:Prolyl oligopeptidase family protein n=1 Tax=Geodermatophilus tzadiensis TaxID=1137988 RepID=A0A2T0TTM2_9ACTN|nr:prolyl oligopeptidase family serine peptidase [Geodermatophilus tzadiensis]PRY49001.1 prolyl oligopeptidase family protein [Geodermatophilus tzadiensis]